MIITGSNNVQLLVGLLAAVALGGLIYLLGPILTPFLLAALLAYICNPLVGRMERRGVNRTVGTGLVLLLLLAGFVVLLLVLFPLLIRQLRGVAEQLPAYVEMLRAATEPWIAKHFGVRLDIAFVKDWLTDHAAQVQQLVVKLLPSITTGGLALLQVIMNIVLVPIVLIYLLRDWNRLTHMIQQMIPRRWHESTMSMLNEIDDVLGHFLRGQLLVMMLMAAFYTLGLWFAGLDYALSVGLIAGLVTFVPYLGVIIGLALATLTGLLQFSDLYSLLWVWSVFILANVMEGYVFVPWLVGDRIGLHPVAVIFALLAFGQLFGFFGVLLALPASAALLVGLRRLRRHYLDSGMYNA
jgi:predicted PurR-regulated permease PerM